MNTMIQLPIKPPIYATTGDLPAGATAGMAAIVLTSPPTLYAYDGSTWQAITSGGGGGGVTAIGSFDSQTPNANGGVISGTSIYFQSASPTVPGMINTSSQIIGGSKKFTSEVLIATSGNFLQLGATNPTTITGSNTVARTLTLPDADSNTVQPLSGATAGSFVSYIDSTGVQHLTAVGSGVTSITQTQYQVLASASTGAVTLTLDPAGISFGTYAGSVPPSSGMIISGVVGIHTATPDVNSNMNIDMALPNGLLINGTTTIGTGPINGILMNVTIAAQVNANCFGIASLPIFSTPSPNTYANAASLYAYNSLNTNVGIITNSIGLFIDTGTSSTGTVTNSFGIYCRHPSGGTTKLTAYFENIVSIGSLTADASAIFSVISTTRGALLPAGTTTQKNAISTPIEGLIFYDNTLHDLQFWNGSSWIGTTISGVTSITGTASEITASASTGGVTLSLPSAIITPGTLAINAMTQGSILFSGASSVVSQNNLDLFWDNTNFLLGVGTATPTARAHLAGNVVSSTNNITNQCGFYNNVSVRPTANITSAALHYLSGTFSVAGGTISTAYGLNIGNFSIGATNNVALRVVSPTSGSTSNTAIYADNLSVGYSNVSPPSLGAIISGFVGIGINNPGSFQLVVTGTTVVVEQINGVQTATGTIGGLATTQAMLYINGTCFPTSSANNSFGIFLNQAFKANTSLTITNAAAINILSTYTTNTNIITNAFGLRITGGSAGTGTISNTTNAYIETPLFGTTGTGNIGVQINGVDSIGSTTGTKYSLYLSGTITGDDGSLIVGIYNNVSLEPTTNSRSVYGIRNISSAIANSTNTINNAYGIYTNISVNPGSGSVTNAYAGYFVAPVSATNLCALYTDNLSVGYTAVTPPTNGAIISGQVSIGTSGAATSTQLTISGSNGISLKIISTQTSVATIIGSTDQAGLLYGGVFSPSSNSGTVSPCFIAPSYNAGSTQTMTTAASIYVRNLANSNAGTITTLYGLFIDIGNSGGGTITNTYGAYISSSLSGTGTNNIGLKINGSDSDGSTTGCRYLLNLGGVITADDSASCYVINSTTNIRPTGNNKVAIGFNNQPQAQPHSTNTISTFYGFISQPTVTVGSGAITTAYSGYFANPTSGATNTISLFTTNLAVGYTGITPPSVGAIINGDVSIGSSSVISNTSLSISTPRSSTGGITYQQLGIAGSFTAASTSGLANMFGISVQTSMIAASAQTVNLVAGIYVSLVASSNVGTLASASGVYIASGSAATGTVSQAIGMTINSQNYGTTQTNLGLYLFGADSTASTTGTSSMLELAGSITGNTSSAIYGINNIISLNPTSNSVNIYGSYNAPIALVNSTNNIPIAYGSYHSLTCTVGSGSITTAYTGYFIAPTAATNRVSLYTADLSVGVTASGVPTAGTIRTAPPASHTAISFGTSLTLGTALQNTLGYDIMVSIAVSVTAAVAANFQIGVGSTNTPTIDNILPATISAAETFTVCVIIPSGYYVLMNKTGTSSTSTNQLIVTAI